MLFLLGRSHLGFAISRSRLPLVNSLAHRQLSMRSSTNNSEDTARLKALQEYQIVDSPSETLFDDITQLASEICHAPISLISFVEKDRQWFKSALGVSLTQTPRSHSFCAHAILAPAEVFVVRDATQDDRFSDNPLVTGEPYIRFYAGAPLVTDQGVALGSLCVLDTRPRELRDAQLDSLTALSRQVVSQLESRRNYRLLSEAATKLKLQKERSQSILDHVPAYVFHKDTTNRILSVNKAVADSLGLSIDQIEGRMSGELYPDHAEEYYQDDLEVIVSKKPKLGIVEVLEGDGQTRWISTDKIPIANQQGDVESLLVVATDITALKNVEASLLESKKLLSAANEALEQRVELKTQQLAASHALYEDLYHSAPDMFVSVDPKSTTIVECNATLLSELGYSRDELIGHPVTKLYHPSGTSKHELVLRAFRERGEVRNQEITLARSDGSPIEVSLNVSAVRNERGNIVASRSVCRDITEIKRLERESQQHLNQVAHLARVAMMNEMATGLAHEINQPLNAIKNYAKGTLRRLEEPKPDIGSLPAVFEQIATNADRAAQLIARLRRYVKPSGKRSTRADASALVTRAAEMIKHEVSHHDCAIRVRTIGEPATVGCDKVQIEQVLINLMLNAVEATADKASDRSYVDVNIRQIDDKWLRIAVEDNGPGLASDQEVKIFDAFYTTKATGLGMGLAICRTIVEAHGGKLEVLENSTDGLTMALDLPLRTPQAS